MPAQLGLFTEPKPPGPAGQDAALSQWFTPEWLAQYIGRWCATVPLEGFTILEPSAGGGALIAPLVEAGADIVAVEIVPELCAGMRRRFAGQKVEVVQGDFPSLRTLPRKVNAAVMNPPYEDRQLTAHIVHALHFAQQVVALVPLSFLATWERFEAVWSKHQLLRVAILVDRVKFDGPGDNSPMRDYCVLDIHRGHPVFPCPVRVEWWPRPN